MLKYLAPLVLFFGAPNIARAQDYKAEIAQAERLGQTLYNYDSAAWGATDAVLAMRKLKPPFLKLLSVTFPWIMGMEHFRLASLSRVKMARS